MKAFFSIELFSDPFVKILFVKQPCHTVRIFTRIVQGKIDQPQSYRKTETGKQRLFCNNLQKQAGRFDKPKSPYGAPCFFFCCFSITEHKCNDHQHKKEYISIDQKMRTSPDKSTFQVKIKKPSRP